MPLDATRLPPSLSLVLPAFNEEATIVQAIREAVTALSGLTADYEVIVVNDSSRDRTESLAQEEARGNASVRVISHPTNQGYGAALRTGFQAATKDLIAFTDADCQFDVRELDRFLLLARDHDVVCGYRIDRQDPWRRRLYSGIYNALVRLLLGTRVRDCDCALKLFRRDLAQRLTLESSGYLINAELLAKAHLSGCSTVEVGVTHRPRGGGASKVSVGDALPALRAMLRFWWSWLLFPRSELDPAEAGPTTPTGPPAAANGGASRPRPIGSLGAPLLCLVAGLLLFSNLSYPLVDPDESRYAQIALEMHGSGDYVVPTRNLEPYLDKPPLLYWLTAASYAAFGIDEWTARLPSAAAALITVLATYFLGRRLVGGRAAWLGALALLLTWGFLFSGRFLIMDGLLTCCTTLCALTGYLGAGRTKLRPGWWIAAGVACGLGILTKGPVAIVLCAPPLLASRWLSGGGARLRLRHWALIAAPAAAISIPWLVLIASRQGEFFGYFFWKHNVVRFFNAFQHREPWWFYLPVVAVGMFPCSLLLPALFRFLLSRSPELRALRTREMGFLLLAAAWVIVFFSLASGKLPPYILPALPPACLLFGRLIDAVLLARPAYPVFARAVWMPPLVAVIALAGLALLMGIASLTRGGAPLGLILDAAAVLTSAALLLGAWWPPLRRNYRRLGIAALVSLAFSAYAFIHLFPKVAWIRSFNREAAQVLSDWGDPSAPVVFFNCHLDFSEFYFQGAPIHTFSREEVGGVNRLAGLHPRMLVITDREDVVTLKQALSPSIELSEIGGQGRLYQACFKMESGAHSN